MSRTPPPSPAARRRRRRHWITVLAIVLLLGAAITVLRLVNQSTAASTPAAPAVGHTAPDGVFTTVSGTTMTVASLRGRPTLLWFVATWCPSCQVGTPAVAREFDQLRAKNVRVVEVQIDGNLGQPGPSIAEFGQKLAGNRYGDPDWIFGTASADMSHTYNPNAYTDLYYLLDATGHVTYIDGEPASTMPDLLTHIGNLS